MSHKSPGVKKLARSAKLARSPEMSTTRKRQKSEKLQLFSDKGDAKVRVRYSIMTFSHKGASAVVSGQKADEEP